MPIRTMKVASDLADGDDDDEQQCSSCAHRLADHNPCISFEAIIEREVEEEAWNGNLSGAIPVPLLDGIIDHIASDGFDASDCFCTSSRSSLKLSHVSLISIPSVFGCMWSLMNFGPTLPIILLVVA